MVPLDATVGGVSANAFLNVMQCDDLLSNRLYVDPWSTALLAGGEKCAAAIITATSAITILHYRGVKTSEAQALAFPRSLLPVPDMLLAVEALLHDDQFDYLQPDMYYAIDVIPDRVLLATALLANGLLSVKVNPFLPSATLGVKSERIGQLETVYADPKDVLRGFALFPEVGEQLRPLLQRTRTGVRRG